MSKKPSHKLASYLLISIPRWTVKMLTDEWHKRRDSGTSAGSHDRVMSALRRALLKKGKWREINS